MTPAIHDALTAGQVKVTAFNGYVHVDVNVFNTASDLQIHLVGNPVVNEANDIILV